MEEEIYDSALSRACLALFVVVLFEGCIYFYNHIWAILTHICHQKISQQHKHDSKQLSALFSVWQKHLTSLNVGVIIHDP